MTFIDCCKRATAEGLMLIRPQENNPCQCDIVPFTGEDDPEEGWVYLDAYTASAVCTVYNALSPLKQADLEAKPPLKAIDLCWKIINELNKR